MFAKMLTEDGFISSREWQTYEMAYDVMTASLRPPSLILYLDVEPAVALDRARVRARGCETGLTLEYLTRLQRGYLDLLVQVERGKHAWSRGMSILRVPWNVDHQGIDGIVDEIRRRT